jgi:hypothetical protein
MTEQQWLEATDPQAMLEFVLQQAMLEFRESGNTNDRKQRLFACACCRRVWHLLSDERSRKDVEAAERFADGDASAETLAALYAAGAAYRETAPRSLQFATREEAAAFQATSCAAAVAGDVPDIEWAMDAAACAIACTRVQTELWGTEAGDRTVEESGEEEGAGQCYLLRCIFGNPFRPQPAIDPAWRAWNDGAVAKLAQSIYEERAFDRLAILADALEKAGCTDADILAHLRGPGPHARGCWAVDLILERR